MIQAELLFSHDEDLDSGKVILTMLKFQNSIEKNLTEVGIKVDYNGDVAVQAEIIVKLEGIFNASLSDDEMQYFEATTRAYLNSKLSKVGVDILDVVAKQVGKQKLRYLQRDDGVSVSSSSIDINTMVYGSYRPPPEIDFSGVLEDALDVEGGSQFRDDLVSGRRDIPPEIMKKVGALKEIKNVNSTSTTRKEILIPDVPNQFPIGALLGGILGFLFLSFFICCWCYRKSHRKKKKSKQLVDLCSGPLNSSKGFFGSKIIGAQCQFQDEDSILAEKSNTFARHPGASSIETLNTSSGIQEDFGALSSAQSVTTGNQAFVSSCNLSEDIIARRYDKNANRSSSTHESACYSGKSRRSQSLQDALRMRSQSTIGSRETMGSTSIGYQTSLEKSMSSLGTNGLPHFPTVSVRNMEYNPEENLSAVRQNIAKGNNMSNVHHSKQMDMHNRSVNTLDLSALRNFALERNSNNWENEYLIHPQSSGGFQNSSEILIQNQGHTLVSDNVSYQQLDPRDFA